MGAVRALLGGVAVALVACGERHAPAPAAPNDAPARDVVVRTSRFAIHANAYVDFYASSPARVASRETSDGDPPPLDPALVAKLGACSDDPCATPVLSQAALEGLGDFLHGTWGAHANGARRVLGTNGTSLMELEDVLAPALAREIGARWPQGVMDVYLAHEKGARDASGGREGAVLDVEGECFEGDALLECLLSRALEVILPESELGRALQEELAKRGDPPDSAPRLLSCVAALAADAAVASAEAHYRPTRRFVATCSEPQRTWLGREWPKRVSGSESPAAFAGAFVSMAPAGSP